jgi:two-component sensor histidine kinase
MATQTFREAPDSEKQAFGARIQALAKAHDGLTQKSWQSASMTDTAARSLSPFIDGREQRVGISGPEVELRPNTALLVSMLLHELGTNAVKYGSLSNLSGTVNLAWRIDRGKDGAIMALEWIEAGGPAVLPPTRKGFGSRLIERALRGENGTAEMRFEPAGLRCFLTIPLAEPLGV